MIAIGPFRSILQELEGLSTDLRALEEGGHPTNDALQSYPLLDKWSFGFLPAACLIGVVDEHPRLGNQINIHTSELVTLDPHRRWARTRSQFYRLGQEIKAPLHDPWRS